MYSDLPEMYWELVEDGQGYLGFTTFLAQTPTQSLGDWDYEVLMKEFDQLETLLLETP